MNTSAVPSDTRREWYFRAAILLAIVVGIYEARNFEWDVVGRGYPLLLRGLGNSILIAVISIALGAVIAVPLSVARVYGPAGIRQLAVLIIEAVRATPELMIVFWIFFGVPGLTGKPMSGWTAGIAAMTIIAAASLAEVMRGGLYSVSQGQWEAAASTGLSKLQAFVHIVMPQAVRNMLPSLVAQLISLFKTTSLVYVIGVIDLFRATVILNNVEFAPFALYTTMAVIYLVCCSLLSSLVKRLDSQFVIIE